MTNVLKILEDLYSKKSTDIKLGLDRLESAYKLLGTPAYNVPTVLVAGTNGKGSTSSYLYMLLQANQNSLGLYTSPHLIHFSERIQTSHQAIDDSQLVGYLQEIQTILADVWGDLTFFEITTLLALYAFEKTQTSLNILEVGMGGRLDATNITDPLLSIITSIGLDHCEYLGDSVFDILREKQAVARDSKTLIAGKLTDELLRQLRKYCINTSVNLLNLGDSFKLNSVRNIYTSQMKREYGLPVFLEDKPYYLKHNFCLALAAYEQLYVQGVIFEPVDRALSFLNSSVVAQPPALKARFEKQQIDTFNPAGEITLDCSHNLDGITELCQHVASQSLGSSRERKTFLALSLLKDKDIDNALLKTSQVFDYIAFFPSGPSCRRVGEQDLGAVPENVHFFQSIEDIQTHVKKYAIYEHHEIFVAGSIYGMGRFLEIYAD